MHTRQVAQMIWREAGLYNSGDAQVQAFLKYFDRETDDCWDKVVTRFRREFDDLFDDIVPPLLESSVKTIRVTLIRRVDLRRKKEVHAIRDLIKFLDPHRDAPEILAIAKRKSRALQEELERRKDIVAMLRRQTDYAPNPVKPRRGNMAPPEPE